MTLHTLSRAASNAWGRVPNQRKARVLAFTTVLLLLVTVPALADGGNPWESAVNALKDSFTGPIAKGLSLVSIIIGGLMFAFGEGGSKKMLSGIVFGLGMVLGAASFMAWLFPG